MMNANLSFLADVDRLCGQFATALHNTEWQVYAKLTLLILRACCSAAPPVSSDDASPIHSVRYALNCAGHCEQRQRRAIQLSDQGWIASPALAMTRFIA
jgi:hypothetical protein